MEQCIEILLSCYQSQEYCNFGKLFVLLMNGHQLLIYSFTLLDTEELLMEAEAYLR